MKNNLGLILAKRALLSPEAEAYVEGADTTKRYTYGELNQRCNQIANAYLNAGIQIAPPDAPLSEYQFEAATLSRYKRMMSVNVDGVVFGLQTLLPLLSPGAAIVVTASLAGVTPYAIDPLYAMSKHAVVGLVRSLAPELAKRGIRIHALCPGAVDTNIIPHAQKAEHSQFMSPDDLAADVIGLMTEHQNGKSWVRLRKDKPRYVIRAPGDKSV